MSNWQYQNQLPVRGYRGANTIARELGLYERNGEVYLKSAPVSEMYAARERFSSVGPVKVSGMDWKPDFALPENGAFEVEMSIRNNGAEKIGIVFCNGSGENVSMYYDIARGQFVMDRTESGNVDFSQDFPAVTVAPAETEGTLSLRIFFDRTSAEVFGNGGEFVMTNLLFPSEPYSGMGFFADRGSFTVTSAEIYVIK